MFDYIKIHNNKLCKKIYRLEISNLPYIIYKHDLYEVYKMVWYINSKYNIVGYKGEIVEKMLNDRLDEIKYNGKENTVMTATNYIDFEMSIDEHEEFTLKYNDTLRTTYYLLINETGLIVNKKGLISLIAELYDIEFNYQYVDKNKEYEMRIKDNNYRNVVLGYLKEELHINNVENTTNSIYTLCSSYIPFNSCELDYEYHLQQTRDKYESEIDDNDIDFKASTGLSQDDLETLRRVEEALSRIGQSESFGLWNLQDRPYVNEYPP